MFVRWAIGAELIRFRDRKGAAVLDLQPTVKHDRFQICVGRSSHRSRRRTTRPQWLERFATGRIRKSRLDREIESTTKSVPAVIPSLATSYAAVGMAEANLSRVNDSLDNYLRGASELQKLVASNPRSVSWNRELMLAYGHAADVSGNPGLQNLGDRKAALNYYQKAAEIGKRVISGRSIISARRHRLWDRP